MTVTCLSCEASQVEGARLATDDAAEVAWRAFARALLERQRGMRPNLFSWRPATASR